MGNKRDKRQKFRLPRGKRANRVSPQSNQKRRSKFHKTAIHQHKNSWPPGEFGATSRPITDADKIGPSFSNARYRDMSERGKSLVLVERIKELFAIRDQGGVLEMEREASADTAKILADEIVNMWPKDWQPKQQERADDSGFRLLFWGPQIPNSVGNAITRASLYANQILIVNPFTDSMLFHPNASPLVRSAEWISTYSITALYIALLEPWIKAGIVELVQNPARFNASLMHKLKQESMKQALPPSDDATMVEIATEMCLQMPEDAINMLLRDDSMPPGFAAKVRDSLAEHAKEPIRAKLPQHSSQMAKGGSGMSYEHARVLATQQGATIFSHANSFCQQLRSHASELRSPFQQVAQAFGHVQLSFLNNVTTDFAVGIRQDGSLAGFRQYLTTLVRGIQASDGSISDTGFRDFDERLRAEYATYGEEWKDIQKKLGMRAFAAIPAGAAATGIAAIATGAFPIAGVLAATFAADVLALLDAVFDRRKLERQPLGMMLRLDRQ